LKEIHRVLAKSGEFGILDFSEPSGIFGSLYSFYFHNVLPKIGSAISGTKSAYQYLPESVHRFPAPRVMVEKMRSAGFSEVSWTAYTFGIAGVYRGRKA
jgi:demethylmenaquinone methyltransferase / 2-methoxy-6-polyprenyl-1,4-benzoquinol methylase